MRHTFDEGYRLDDDLLRKIINPKYLSKEDQKRIEQKVGQNITRLLRKSPMLAEEISERLKIPEKMLNGYLDRMEIAEKLKSEITEYEPYEKVYSIGNKFKLLELEPLNDGSFEYSLEKRVKNPEILANARLYCDDCPSLIKAIENYTKKNQEKWALKANEKVGFLIRGKQGYNPEGKCRKQVEFYRLN